MRITELLGTQAVDLQVRADNKEELLRKAVALMVRQGNISDEEQYFQAVLERETEGTTGVGQGIAIPHGRCEGVTRPGLVAMVLPEGVEYDSLDGEPVKLVFLIAADMQGGSAHIDILSKLSGMLMEETFTKALMEAKTPEEFLNIIDREEENKDREEALAQGEAKGFSTVQGGKRLLAVTACPTGIAHTFMAAEAIERSAKAHGCSIKVETRGAGGAKNVITPEEIKEADCIIVAADTKVPLSRFAGKRLMEVPVSEGIGRADMLVERALTGEVPIYYSKEEAGEEIRTSEGSAWHQIYKHLMNGVSHMLPFVVGGGILIALAFLIDGLVLSGEELEQVGSAFGTVTPWAEMFKTIGGVAFGFMLPTLAGFIAMSIADRPGLAVGFVGGSIAASGKSGFLGAMAAGFLAGCIIRILSVICRKLPKAIEGLKPILIYPVFGIFFIGIIMLYVIEPAVGGINSALNEALQSLSGASSALLGFVLGGMMAIDMGGPFNKASYLFGTAAIAAGNYAIMAAVMIGGMVPPCAIALATILFRDKFTSEERKSGPTNFVMGLSFITEGAIPFAAADPLRVIPSCILGAGVAGMLSMIFGCTLMAPHGGVFVFPVVGKALLYSLSLVVGTVVTAVTLGLLKKKVV